MERGAGEPKGGRARRWASVALLALFIYGGPVRSLLPGLPLPAIPGGLDGLTLLLVLFSLVHASYALGPAHAAVFFGLSAAVSWLFEQVGVATGLVYGPYHYTDYLGPRLGDVPLLIPLAWFMMIYPSYTIAGLIVAGRPFGSSGGAGRVAWLALIGAAVMTAWDMVVDPILSSAPYRAWVWEAGGPYLGVPVRNFVGWLATTLTVYALYRTLEHRRPGRAAGPLPRWLAGLPLVAYGAMLAADLLAGGPLELVVIGPFAMGLPLLAATARLLEAPPG